MDGRTRPLIEMRGQIMKIYLRREEDDGQIMDGLMVDRRMAGGLMVDRQMADRRKIYST